MYPILPMSIAHIPLAITIWGEQFGRYCKNDAFPDFFEGGKYTIEQYLAGQIAKGNAIVAVRESAIAGYMAWMYFDFHGERTAFLPTVGSAAAAKNENTIHHALYREASGKWVRDNRLNHLWMTFYDDTGLRDMLYEVGFGSYVIDACQKTSSGILAAETSYSAGSLCAYIRPEYRGKGIGSQLVRHAFAHCHKAGKHFLHVSFESANPDAMRFWPKHFKPAIRSVRRTVNKDANFSL